MGSARGRIILDGQGASWLQHLCQADLCQAAEWQYIAPCIQQDKPEIQPRDLDHPIQESAGLWTCLHVCKAANGAHEEGVWPHG